MKRQELASVTPPNPNLIMINVVRKPAVDNSDKWRIFC
jgi:hypothetical protein